MAKRLISPSLVESDLKTADQIENILLEVHDGINYSLGYYFKVIQILGRGGFGTVVAAYDKFKNDEVAIKIALRQREQEYQALKNEAKMLEKLKHQDNIIQLKFLKIYQDHALLGTQKIKRSMTLTQFIQREKRKRGAQMINDREEFMKWEDTCQIIMRQIFNGVKNIHRKNIIHRDIKPSNILIKSLSPHNSLHDQKPKEQDSRSQSTSPAREGFAFKTSIDESENLQASEKYEVRIIDFGLAIDANKDNTDQRGGTVLYEAPEQLSAQNQYSKAVDMWSCGIILFELLTFGQHPIWKTKDEVRDLFKVDLRNHSAFKKVRPSENCIQLLENLLSISQSVRYKSEDVLTHPWVIQDSDQPLPESPLIKKAKMVTSFEKLTKAFSTVLITSVLALKLDGDVQMKLKVLQQRQEELLLLAENLKAISENLDESNNQSSIAMSEEAKEKVEEDNQYALEASRIGDQMVYIRHNFSIPEYDADWKQEYTKFLYFQSKKSSEDLNTTYAQSLQKSTLNQQQSTAAFSTKSSFLLQSHLMSFASDSSQPSFQLNKVLNRLSNKHHPQNHLDESSLNVEEVDEQTLGSIYQGFHSRLDAKSVYSNSVIKSNGDINNQTNRSNSSSVERTQISIATNKEKMMMINRYQSNANLSPVNEVITPADEKQISQTFIQQEGQVSSTNLQTPAAILSEKATASLSLQGEENLIAKRNGPRTLFSTARSLNREIQKGGTKNMMTTTGMTLTNPSSNHPYDNQGSTITQGTIINTDNEGVVSTAALESIIGPSLSTKMPKTLRKIHKSPENQSSNPNFIQIKAGNQKKLSPPQSQNNSSNQKAEGQKAGGKIVNSNNQSMLMKNIEKVKKQQDKVRVIIQSSQAQQRKQSYLSDQASKSPSPDGLTNTAQSIQANVSSSLKNYQTNNQASSTQSNCINSNVVTGSSSLAAGSIILNQLQGKNIAKFDKSKKQSSLSPEIIGQGTLQEASKESISKIKQSLKSPQLDKNAKIINDSSIRDNQMNQLLSQKMSMQSPLKPLNEKMSPIRKGQFDIQTNHIQENIRNPLTLVISKSPKNIDSKQFDLAPPDCYLERKNVSSKNNNKSKRRRLITGIFSKEGSENEQINANQPSKLADKFSALQFSKSDDERRVKPLTAQVYPDNYGTNLKDPSFNYKPSPRKLPREVQDKLKGIQSSVFGNSQSFNQKNQFSSRSPETQKSPKQNIDEVKQHQQELKFFKKSSQLGMSKLNHFNQTEGEKPPSTKKSISPQSLIPNSTKRYKSQENEAEKSVATPYQNLMLLQIKEEISKPYLQHVEKQKDMAKLLQNQYLGKNQQPSPNVSMSLNYNSNGSGGSKPSSCTNAQGIKLQPLTNGNQPLLTSLAAQVGEQYHSFLRNASARHLIQDELRKLQETAAKNSNPKKLKIKGEAFQPQQKYPNISQSQASLYQEQNDQAKRGSDKFLATEKGRTRLSSALSQDQLRDQQISDSKILTSKSKDKIMSGTGFIYQNARVGDGSPLGGILSLNNNYMSSRQESVNQVLGTVLKRNRITTSLRSQ